MDNDLLGQLQMLEIRQYTNNPLHNFTNYFTKSAHNTKLILLGISQGFGT